MSSNDEGSLMTDNAKQNHASKQFQPGSPDKRKNNHSRNMNMNININSPNSYQRNKRKQPRSLPHQSQQLQLQHQLSPKEKEKETQQNQQNHTDHTSKQDNSNLNDWQLNFDHNKNKKNGINKPKTPSFDNFFESLTAQKEKNKKHEKMNKDNKFTTQNNSKSDNDDLNDMNDMDEYNALDDNKNNNDQMSMSNLLQSQYSNDNKQAPFIEEQLTGIFDELDLEICATQNLSHHVNNNNNNGSSPTSPRMLNYQNNNSDDGLDDIDDIDDIHNDDYKMQHKQYKPQQKKTKKNAKTRHDSVATPQCQIKKAKYKLDYNDTISPMSNQYNKPLYVHASGKKMSDESFKFMQQCLSGLEQAKHIAKQTNAMQQLSKIQQNICKKVKRKHKNEYGNSSDEEKMSVDNINISPSYSIQSPQEQQQQQYTKQQYTKQHKYRKKTPKHKYRKKTPKHKYYHTNYNQTGNMSHNNNTITNINIIHEHEVRKQLSFCSAANDNPDLQYDYGMSSPQIIQKQKQKINRTNQEINDLQNELNCVYNTLNAVQKNRSKLFEDIKSMRKDYSHQIQSIHKQYYQFKQQTNLFQKEKKEIEYDIQQQNKYQHDLSSINVSPVKSSNKSNRKQRYYQYK